MAAMFLCCTPELDEVTLLHADHSKAVLEEIERRAELDEAERELRTALEKQRKDAMMDPAHMAAQAQFALGMLDAEPAPAETPALAQLRDAAEAARAAHSEAAERAAAAAQAVRTLTGEMAAFDVEQASAEPVAPATVETLAGEWRFVALRDYERMLTAMEVPSMMQSMVTSQFNGQCKRLVFEGSELRAAWGAPPEYEDEEPRPLLAGSPVGTAGFQVECKEPQIFTFVSPDDGGVREIRTMPQSSKMYVEQIYETLRGAQILCIRERAMRAHDHSEFATARRYYKRIS